MPKLKKTKCIACRGTGKNSKGKECFPCRGSGFKLRKHELKKFSKKGSK